MALLKTEVPRFAAGESLGAKVNRMYRYLQDLQRGLDFVLSHLGAENMNGNGFTLPVLSADGKEELGSLGAAGDGVGLMHGGWGLRVTANGIEVTEDGKTWGPLETGGAGEAPDLSGYVPTSRKVNNKALSSDISLDASDVGARSSSWMPTAANVGAVAKTGDTMTGTLTFSNANAIIKKPNMDVTASSISAQQIASFAVEDKNNTYVSWFDTYQDTDGTVRLNLVVRRNAVSNGIYLEVNKSGTRSVSVSDAAKWRAALGVSAIQSKTVTGTTDANGFINLGVANGSYIPLVARSSNSDDHVEFTTGSSNWWGRVTNKGAARKSTSVSIVVYYTDKP